MRNGIYDIQRHGTTVAISPDRRLAAFADNLGRVAVLDITKGHIIRLFKGCRDAQFAFVQVLKFIFFSFAYHQPVKSITAIISSMTKVLSVCVVDVYYYIFIGSLNLRRE